MADEEQVVSWQSAFFGIALIALNSMAREGGPALGVHDDKREAMFCSPIICLLDTLYILGYLSIKLIKGCRLSEAIKSAAAAAGEESKLSTSSEGGLQERKAPLKVLVIDVAIPIAAILQLVKVMGFHGVPWTQAFAMFYATNYFLRETLRRCPTSSAAITTSRESGDQEISRQRLQKRLDKEDRVIAALLLVQMISWSWLLTKLWSWLSTKFADTLWSELSSIPGSFSESEHSIQVVIESLVVFFITMNIGVAYMNDINVMLLAVVVSIMAFVILPDLMLYERVAQNHQAAITRQPSNVFLELIHVFWATLVLGPVALMAMFALFFATSVVFGLVKLFSERFGYKIDIVHMYMVLGTFVPALVYYTKIYSSVGTVKPAWTENLG